MQHPHLLLVLLALHLGGRPLRVLLLMVLLLLVLLGHAALPPQNVQLYAALDTSPVHRWSWPGTSPAGG
jgi:hypothetical protein